MRSAEAWRSRELSFQEDVVDQADGADLDCRCQDRGVLELDELDIVRSQSVEETAGGEDCVLASCVRLSSHGERSRQSKSAFALLGREAYVPRRERESVIVAHGRQDPDLHAEVQVANELADHECLLRILLAEVRTRGADDVEELQADGGDRPEVARTCAAFGARAFDVDPGSEPGWVDLPGVRREEDVDALSPRDLGVAFLVAWIGSEVSGVTELRGVDEERRNDDVTFGARGPEERAVAVVQRAHGGYE